LRTFLKPEETEEYPSSDWTNDHKNSELPYM
jgi:hypothetical protein